MYKWRLVFELTSGKTLVGIYEGKEADTDSVARVFLDGKLNQYIGMKGDCEKPSNLFIKRGDIAALNIFPY